MTQTANWRKMKKLYKKPIVSLTNDEIDLFPLDDQRMISNALVLFKQKTFWNSGGYAALSQNTQVQ